MNSDGSSSAYVFDGLAPTKVEPRFAPVARFIKRKPLGAFGALLLLVLLFAAIFGGDISLGPIAVGSVAPYGHSEYRIGQDQLLGPSRDHLMGTDELGRDIFSRILYGARLSVAIGLGVFVVSGIISNTITIVSAYYLKTVDIVVQRVVEVFAVLPEIVVLISLFSIYGATPFTFILTFGVMHGLTGSRVLRSMVISIRSSEYVKSAQAIGASDARIMAFHIFPNVAFYIIVSAASTIILAITAESALSIVGFGINPTYPSWGNMINASRDYMRVAPHMVLFPSMALALTVFGLRLLGDALRDVLDPRQRGL